MHGIGTFTFSNGSVYSGDFVNGVSHGEGVFTFPDGAVYEGEFKNGKKMGRVFLY